MDTNAALEFLRNHQPMPGDFQITEEDSDTYVSILEHFEKNPDPACIPLFINSVSEDTGLGMYENIRFVFLAHQKNDIVPHLREGLSRANHFEIICRYIWWATDINAWELEDIIRPLLNYENGDVREVAGNFLELKEYFKEN